MDCNVKQDIWRFLWNGYNFACFANVCIIWGGVVCVYNINNNTDEDLEFNCGCLCLWTVIIAILTQIDLIKYTIPQLQSCTYIHIADWDDHTNPLEN